jgi:hypothetical protein
MKMHIAGVAIEAAKNYQKFSRMLFGFRLVQLPSEATEERH